MPCEIPIYEDGWRTYHITTLMDKTFADVDQRHIFNACVDMHVSDVDGQQHRDIVRNTKGKMVMCKLMLNASKAMQQFEDTCKAIAAINPYNGDRMMWTVALKSHARRIAQAKAKAKAAAKTMNLTYHGVAIT